jgi:hypothetical protein
MSSHIRERIAGILKSECGIPVLSAYSIAQSLIDGLGMRQQLMEVDGDDPATFHCYTTRWERIQ